MLELTQTTLISFESAKKPRKKHTDNPNRKHVLREMGKNKVIAIPPHIVNKLGLVPGLDAASAELDGNKVVFTFHRRGSGFQT